jgi:hypothetical protein
MFAWTPCCSFILHKYYLDNSHIFQRADLTVEPGYNDIGLYDTSLIESDILWFKLIPYC